MQLDRRDEYHLPRHVEYEQQHDRYPKTQRTFDDQLSG
jgi:hypothetical protein